MERKNTILLTVIAIATLLVAVVGATFAYFTATITDERGADGNNGNTNVTAGKVAGATVVGVVDGAAGSFTTTDVYPGHKEVAALSVKVTAENSGASKINIVYDVTNNTFAKDNIKVSVYKTNTKVNTAENYFNCTKETGSVTGATSYFETCTVAETTLGTLVGTSTLLDTGATTNKVIATDTVTGSASGNTVYYYVVVEYVNQESDQNAEFNATLAGNISVELAA